MFPSNMPTWARIMGSAIPIIAVSIFVFTFILMLSPKLRGKMMAKQIKAMKHMTDYSKEDLTDINTTMGNVGIDSRKRILDQNEDTLKDMTTREAQINSKGLEITARALKKGFTGENIYCKHCGASIDEDSKFCKKCGKEL